MRFLKSISDLLYPIRVLISLAKNIFDLNPYCVIVEICFAQNLGIR